MLRGLVGGAHRSSRSNAISVVVELHETLTDLAGVSLLGDRQFLRPAVAQCGGELIEW